MSGLTGNNILAGSSGQGGYEIEQSLRFNDDDSAYLSRTPASAGNRKTWTWSGWVKRGNLGTIQDVFTMYGGSASDTEKFNLRFNNDKIYLDAYYFNFRVTTQVFRDVGAWYHIALAFDTTQATANDRIKLYVNGVQITDFDTTNNPSLNTDYGVNATAPHYLGRNGVAASVYYDGYLAEVNFIDGQALTPSDFGETDPLTNQWIPKKYVGTYGTNGFYLPFGEYGYPGKDAATSLGSELVVNGTFDTNTNNWTAYGGATLSVSDKRLSVSGSTDASAYQAISVESGSTYSVGVNIDIGNVAGLRLGIEYNLGSRDGTETPTNQGGDFRFNFTSSITGTVYVRCFLQGPGTAYFDNISVKKINSQGNDWTPNNLVATDQVLDSPTNNFCTLPSTSKSTYLTLSEGNLKTLATSSSYWATAHGSFGISSGKWYWEVYLSTSSVGWNRIGIQSSSENVAGNQNVLIGNTVDSWCYKVGTGESMNNSTTYTYGAAAAQGDVIGVAFDMDAGTLVFYKNGVSQGTAFSSLSGTYVPATSVAIGDSANGNISNFGQDSSFSGNKTAQGNTDANGIGDFYHAPPSGYLALCEDNLPDPSIALPGEHFNTALYVSNNSTLSVTGVGFQPDFTWHKNRTNTNRHALFDVVRGATNRLASNLTDAEVSDGDTLTSFDSDGFSIGADSGQFGVNYTAGSNFVTWCWKADNTSGSSNTDGTITSTVSANTTAGFSIVSYTGDANGSSTVGHGLGAAPDVVIVKRRDVADGWPVYHSSLGVSKVIELHSTSGEQAGSNYWGSAITSTTFGLSAGGSNNRSGSSNVAYCFAEVEGYSKFGLYTGNGSTDGPFVYTGFRPAFVMIKAIDNTVATTYQSWKIIDSTRYDYNADIITPALWANASYAEGARGNGSTSGYVTRNDLLSNGFKLGALSSYEVETNQSGIRYIYMAFAEMPFKYSNAR
jgi:hypothetical protein